MDERRRKERSELDTQLKIKRLNGEQAEEAEVTVTDVSVGGIGFISKVPLEKGAVYQGKLTLWTKEQLQVFLNIVRVREENGKYNCGATFIGMPEFQTNRIGVYQAVVRETKKE